MPWFGRGRGGGLGFGRGYWSWGYGFGRGVWGPGWGRGNPYPFCRFFPWLPRRWWAMGLTPYGYSYGVAPYWPYAAQPWGAYTPPATPASGQ